MPVGKLAREQASTAANLPELLGRRIKGQDAALAAIAKGIQAAFAGLRSPSQPLGVFLLAGPSGVGKTETGLALADILFHPRVSGHDLDRHVHIQPDDISILPFAVYHNVAFLNLRSHGFSID